MLPAGVVLTGGGARIAGAAELARMSSRCRSGSAPQGVGGLMDQLSNPPSARRSACCWGARHAGEEPMSYATGSSFSGVGGRVMDWIRGDLPG